jgi:hypothetical protein
MISNRIQTITSILDGFTGNDNEPANDSEFYILKSMWVMMMSEFEGTLKDSVESHIDRVKNLEVKDIPLCILLQHTFPNKDSFTMDDVIKVYKQDPKKISYLNFTKNKKIKYKPDSVQNLFITLGIILSSQEMDKVRLLEGMASTRDAIAHGDQQISITRSEIEQRLIEIKEIYSILERKLA